jgi:hypothetical protein
MEGVSVIRTTIGTDDVVYTVTILFCHVRCQCYKEDYRDVRRCIHGNYIIQSSNVI